MIIFITLTASNNDFISFNYPLCILSIFFWLKLVYGSSAVGNPVHFCCKAGGPAKLLQESASYAIFLHQALTPYLGLYKLILEYQDEILTSVIWIRLINLLK